MASRYDSFNSFMADAREKAESKLSSVKFLLKGEFDKSLLLVLTKRRLLSRAIDSIWNETKARYEAIYSHCEIDLLLEEISDKLYDIVKNNLE